jgi:hypothetical protein
MDSKPEDGQRNRVLEDALARRMRRVADLQSLQNASDCLDAAMISAYAERMLQPDENAKCESHFAACARCRRTLTVLASVVDASFAEETGAPVEPLAATASVPNDVVTSASKPPRPNRFEWRVRWLAPAFGMAAVLVVWFVMRPPWGTIDHEATGTLIAEAPKTPLQQLQGPPPTDQFATATPKHSVESDAITRNNGFASGARSSQPTERSLPKDRLAVDAATGAPAPSGSGAKDAIESLQTGQAELKVVVPPQAPLPVPAPRAQVRAKFAGQTPSAGAVSGGANPATAVAQETPLVSATENRTLAPPAVDLPLNGRDFQDRVLSLSAPRQISIQVRSPSGTILWRVGVGGRIERSTDSGSNWTLQQSPLQEDWLAGGASSDTVAWLVGRNGAIARTADGEHWEKVSPPLAIGGASGKMPDWTGIVVRSAQDATVTTAEGRRYVTQDGGKIWLAQ